MNRCGERAVLEKTSMYDNNSIGIKLGSEYWEKEEVSANPALLTSEAKMMDSRPIRCHSKTLFKLLGVADSGSQSVCRKSVRSLLVFFLQQVGGTPPGPPGPSQASTNISPAPLMCRAAHGLGGPPVPSAHLGP